MRSISGFNKIIALLLVCLMLIPVFAGCKGVEENEDSETESATEIESTTEIETERETVAETETESETETETEIETQTEIESDLDLIAIVVDGKSDYVIVRSASADGTEKNAAIQLRTAIKEKFGVTLQILLDNQQISGNAIYVGNVDCEKVKAVRSELGYSDYVISVNDGDVIMCGGSSEFTANAVTRFTEEFISSENDALELPADLNIEEKQTGSKIEVKLGGIDLKEYSVVLANDELYGTKSDVELMHEYCVENFGFGLTVTNSMSAETKHEIIIGKDTSRVMSAELEAKLSELAPNQGYICFENGRVWLTGNTDEAVREAILTFKEKLLDASKATDGSLEITAENIICEFSDREYTVMSFNLLFEEYEAGFCGTPEERTPAVLAQIREADPDILGAQECTEYWYEALCEALGEEYGVVGEMNDPKGQRWRNPIFYKKDNFELIETQTFWLTKTHTIKSKYVGSSQYRILTYAVLKDKETGKTFVHGNTHLGFEHDEKPHHWKYLIQLLDGINYPIILTGDFNAVRTESYHQQIHEAGYWNSIDMTTDCNTDSNLDFVFVTPETVHVKQHYSMARTVNIDGVDMRPSDHLSVVTKFYLR